ncbi:MAG: ABC transporter permease [Chloracidobacterium sp.]|nr:ABC transporter permease [Chloracidobacterium sp.]
MSMLACCKRLLTKPHLRLMALVGVIVPRHLRADWRREWEAELRHREELLTDWDRLDWRSKLDLLRRSTSAFWDALWLQPKRVEDEMFQDLRFGVRMLFKHRGFTAVAAFTLALGIGANTAMFSFVDAALFKPLAYLDPERLVEVREQMPNGLRTIPDIPSYQEWRARNQVFSHMSAITSVGGDLNLTGRGAAERMRGNFVSANYFELLGVQPAMGRAFSADEERAGKEHVAVLSNRCWRQRFGADPNALGASIRLNNESYTIIGVLPPHPIFDRYSTEVWLPLVFTAEQIRSQTRFFSVTARLKPGVSVEQADAEMKRITEGLARQGLTVNENASASVLRLRDAMIFGPHRKMLLLLMGAVFFILLIACANVANLLLARAAARRREVVIRAALGAGRLRVMRQLLTESLLLSLLGGCAGTILAYWLVKGIAVLTPPFTLPSEVEATIDSRVLLFTTGASFLTGLIFGLAPAWQATRINLADQLQDRGYGASARFSRNKLRSLLLVSEVAMTLVLVIGAGLLIRSFARLLQVDTGFQTEHILTFETNLDKNRYQQSRQIIDFQSELLNRMRAIPGAQSAAVTNSLPLNAGGLYTRITISGRSPGAPMVKESAAIRMISSDYFGALGVRLLKGRLPSERDTAQTLPIAVINQTLAKRYWSDRDPIGEQIQFGEDFGSPTVTIVGVIADLKYMSPERAADPDVYALFDQLPEKAFSSSFLSSAFRSLQFAVRTTGEPQALTSSIKRIAADIDKNQPLYGVKTMARIYSDSVARPRFWTTLFSVFGSLALALAAVGVYGVMSYSVAQRTREIGVRIALGARTGDVLRLVMKHGLAVTAAGVAAGLGAAVGLTRFLTAFLFEVKPADLPTYIGVTLFLSSVAIAATYIPARRATKVDPMASLRHE